MKTENKTTIITGRIICKWVGIIGIVAAVILFIFDWLKGEIECDYAFTATAFGFMCLYVSKLLKPNNEKKS